MADPTRAAGREVERARRDIEALARSGHDTAAFADATRRVIEDLVPHSAACVVSLDPTTLLLTGSYKFGLLAGRDDLDQLWATIEYGNDEPTALCALAYCDPPAGSLHSRPGGLAASLRGRRLLEPFGFADEVRMVARHNGHCWGAVNLFRVSAEPPFSDDEVRTLASLSEAVSAGLRAGLLVRRAGCDDAAATPMSSNRGVHHGPAVLVVDAEGRQRRVSPGTGDLLAELTNERNRAPAASLIEALAQRARRCASGASELPARFRVRRADGSWLVAHAAPLVAEDRTTDEVVVTVEEARPPEIVPLLVAAFDLSAREQEVTLLVLQGHSTKAIAGALHMSGYTVQDHLKAIFEKANVRSRRELVSRVFFEQYAPRLGEQLVASVEPPPAGAV